MKILWQSSSPETRTAYGLITKELAKRLVAAGHFVRIATKHEYVKWSTYEGIEIFEGTDTYLVTQMLEREKFDLLFSFWDFWVLYGRRLPPKQSWVVYAPINMDILTPCYLEVLKNTSAQIAMTRYGERILKAAGFDCMYAPHGIDTSVYRPDEDGRRRFRNDLGWGEDIFIIGSVGLNYGDDTKGYVTLMRAFKEFHNAHPDSRLFLCTLANERHAVKACLDYHQVAVTLGIDKYVAWPDQSDYFYYRIRDDDLRSYYCGMDVFALPTLGESFCLPLIEAQACGTPVIVSDSTSGPELCKTGWLIDVDELDDARWFPTGAWRYAPSVRATLQCLELAYNAWKWSDYGKLRRLARERVLEYGWDSAWDTYWVPVWQALEAKYGGK